MFRVKRAAEGGRAYIGRSPEAAGRSRGGASRHLVIRSLCSLCGLACRPSGNTPTWTGSCLSFFVRRLEGDFFAILAGRQHGIPCSTCRLIGEVAGNGCMSLCYPGSRTSTSPKGVGGKARPKGGNPGRCLPILSQNQEGRDEEVS